MTSLAAKRSLPPGNLTLKSWSIRNGNLNPVLPIPLIARSASRQEEGSRSPVIKRTKIWELSPSFHCSIIGTCLTLGELRVLLRKFDLPAGKKNPDDHEIHSIAVGSILQNGILAKQLQKLLDQRHKIPINQLSKLTSPEALLDAWKTARQKGDIPGTYWAIMSHPVATSDVVKQVFADVHMLSHLVGAANRADIHKLSALEEEKAALEDRLDRMQVQLRDGLVAREEKIRQLTTLLSKRIEQEVPSRSASDHGEITTLNKLVAELRRQLDGEIRWRERNEKKLAEAQAAKAAAEEHARNLEDQNASLQAEIDVAEQQLTASADHQGAPQSRPLELHGATILYVGGPQHHVAHLRNTVQQADGQFLHHDGGVEEHEAIIPGLISRADAVVFPVDYVSHRAVLLVKRQCQQSGKPYIPLRSAGVTSLLHGLNALRATAHAEVAE